MDCLKNESTIRNYLGGASFVSGLICFACGTTYGKLFGKLGSGGLIVYLETSLIVFYLIWGLKRIQVPERFQGVAETILYVAICFISVELDKLLPGKSDALSIVSYGLFTLMSVCTSRKSELGFETGFFSFFLSLFLGQLFKTNFKLFPIAVVFCLAALRLRHRLQSGSPNGGHPQEVSPLINATTPAIIDNHEYLNVECQYPPGVGQDLGESPSSASNHENNQEVSFEAAHHSPINYGGVSEESILEVVWDNQQNNDQEYNQPDLLLLDHCFLCRNRLLPGKDIFMYKGDTGFCSVECRDKKISMDKAKDEKGNIQRAIRSSLSCRDYWKGPGNNSGGGGFAY